jgi:hypothetical protein
MCRACSTDGENRNAYRILVGKTERKSPLGRPRRRWVDAIKINLTEMRWDGMGWIDLAQDRDQWEALVNMVMNLRVPQNAGKFLSGCTISGLGQCESEDVRMLISSGLRQGPRGILIF